jgi:hypothetical protein
MSLWAFPGPHALARISQKYNSAENEAILRTGLPFEHVLMLPYMRAEDAMTEMAENPGFLRFFPETTGGNQKHRTISGPKSCLGFHH